MYLLDVSASVAHDSQAAVPCPAMLEPWPHGVAESASLITLSKVYGVVSVCAEWFPTSSGDEGIARGER